MTAPLQTTAPVDATEPTWYRATSLDERRHRRGPDDAVDPDIGARRLALWREEPVYRESPGRLADMLARRGLDEAGLVGLLGESAQATRARFAPGELPFARRIADAWTAAQAAGAPHPPGAGRAPSPADFAAIAGPLFSHGRSRLVKRLAEVTGSRNIAEHLAPRLGGAPVEQVVDLMARTLVLELNVLRVRGELPGADEHERFLQFLELLRNPVYALGVLREYPVLAADLVRLFDNWEDSRVEFVQRLVADLPELAEHRGGPLSLHDVEEVSFGAGDSHRNGRSVAIVRFSDGVRIMYKPRCLHVDRHFQDLLEWLNARGAEPAQRTFWVLDRPEYGWTEFVSAAPCADRRGLTRFYRRQGGLLALLHMLGAVDCHLENIIAAGEHPTLIDLEALFHTWRHHVPDDDVAQQVMRDAAELMNTSVLGVGLLPTPTVWYEGGKANQLDMSGMAGAGGQLTSSPVATWDSFGSDRMRLVRQRVALPASANLPALPDETFTAAEFRDDLVEGYRSMYRLLMRERPALLSPTGVLAAFGADETRVVVRPTRAYGHVLGEGRHPDLLRDGLDRDRFYDNLWSGHVGHDNRDRLIAAELRQLHGGDIPVFFTTPASTTLTGGDGTILPGMLESSGLEVARSRLSALSEAHLDQQTWFIEASLTALVMGGAETWRPARVDVGPVATAPADQARYLAAAREIGDRLLSTAIGQDDRIAWLGLSLVAEQVWTLQPAGMDLYNGVTGIGLFLGYLARSTGVARYRRAAGLVADSVVRQADAVLATPGPSMGLDIGAFGALGGAVYALSHLAVVLDRPDLAATAEQLVTPMAAQIADDRQLDVIGGCAGGLLALLALHAVRPAPATLDVATSMARHLRSFAEPVGGGLGWRSSVNAAAPLAGFSHGASGIAVALARLDRCVGRTDHRRTVLDAVRFERSLFDDACGNWRDDRADVGGSDMVAWCHGAGGVGLARVEMLHYLDGHPMVLDDLRRAARALADCDPAVVFNHSICHGRLGNAEALLVAARALQDRELTEKAAVMAACVLEEIEQGAWRCGVPFGVETPGLMSGLAGIGHALLRLSDPDSVPSVLMVQPPVPV